MTLRDRRLGNEWKFLLELQHHNPQLIEDARRHSLYGGDWLEFTLRETSALNLSRDAEPITVHHVKLHFPDYFPAVPIEAYLAMPVLHPNIHAANGFVCLWDTFSSGDSVIDAVRQLQRVLTWELLNANADHLMQPDALQNVPDRIPLPYRPIQIPAHLSEPRAYTSPPLNRRKRLS